MIHGLNVTDETFMIDVSYLYETSTFHTHLWNKWKKWEINENDGGAREYVYVYGDRFEISF